MKGMEKRSEREWKELLTEQEESGFWIHFKRLERGRFKWTEITDGEKTMQNPPLKQPQIIISVNGNI